jgi:hypothetical protein
MIRRFSRIHRLREAACAILPRGHPETAAECAAKNLVILEAARESHIQNRIPPFQQLRGLSCCEAV